LVFYFPFYSILISGKNLLVLKLHLTIHFFNSSPDVTILACAKTNTNINIRTTYFVYNFDCKVKQKYKIIYNCSIEKVVSHRKQNELNNDKLSFAFHESNNDRRNNKLQ
jgi:hypothetical protein